ncbi:MAG: (2Fe-2S)-binding protein [Acidimicrobiia bacterium]|nr:(2Fe-2S)-binding protein [Acidimicrobiia bacterium]
MTDRRNYELSITVNGVDRRAKTEVRASLADFLRDTLGLTGTHLGCEHGVCGACTVLVDDMAVRSCLVLAVQTDGRQVTTVEGFAAADGTLHPIQESFARNHALQCGFCTPGFLATVSEYLAEQPDASEAEVRERLAGNLCRCTGYQNIVDAVMELAKQTDGDLA